ncbi:hypothetical protein MKX03_003624 [Papaver bracteatum]|nr:hypothetical protein MKX03_003624 [Papaver bracteatum]
MISNTTRGRKSKARASNNITRETSNREWPGAQLYLYDSCANSFGVSKSDIDVYLAIEEPDINKKELIDKLAEIFEANNLENVKLLRDYAQIDGRLRQLAYLVKHWDKSRGVNETYRGTLSSYAKLSSTFDEVKNLPNFGAASNESIAYLVKHAKDWIRRIGNDRHLICIEDPFETSHDLGRIVDKFTRKTLRKEFDQAADVMQYDPDPCVTLFEPYVPSSNP